MDCFIGLLLIGCCKWLVCNVYFLFTARMANLVFCFISLKFAHSYLKKFWVRSHSLKVLPSFFLSRFGFREKQFYRKFNFSPLWGFWAENVLKFWVIVPFGYLYVLIDYVWRCNGRRCWRIEENQVFLLKAWKLSCTSVGSLTSFPSIQDNSGWENPL